MIERLTKWLNDGRVIDAMSKERLGKVKRDYANAAKRGT